ncbi:MULTISPECIES: glycosyltransferase family 4 protein [unclassified Moorena]|uniref:glycosyltransferase family 4 protein n=1 Tax=unclassified Moorena TaxID=2683338 RepID=UPI0013FFE8DD|nr:MULTISPECIES: glycosyltransferase family 4 protein [unclassified Moorena]NEO14811.1 glycosyltransferase family 4 protein [Moorena sp. SIO3E8]NEP97692.1 glycosyltransferase family 4 protein [Moorena sp. SIO3F7]
MSQLNSLKLLLISTPVGPLGSGLGGGVELTVRNIATELINRGHRITIVATKGSTAWGMPLVEIDGVLQTSIQTQTRDTPTIIPPSSVLANMWDYGRQVQTDYDLIVNFAYDWLPFYLTPFFTRPIAHLVSMGSLTEAMDQIIEQVAINFPGTIGVHSMAQGATFSFKNRCRCLGNGIDLSVYSCCDSPSPWLGWVGRISPEKGLEDAVAASDITATPLKIMGLIQNQPYWQQILNDYPNAPIEYLGFLPTDQLQKHLRQCRALLMTPHWVEAFSTVAMEALACGVPVISYDRGGSAEIIEDGKNGFLVEPDSVEGLVEALGNLDRIDRRECRRLLEVKYSNQAMGDRVEQWLWDILKESRDSC